MDSRIILVTGANRGIGLEVCKQLSQMGHKVILTSRNSEKGKTALTKINDNGNSIKFHQLDVTDEESISKCVDFVDNEFGHLDVLVNNAGIFLDNDNSVMSNNLDVFEKTFDINLFGVIKVTKKFLPLLKKSAKGRIVNISSRMGALENMTSGSPAYRISKTALNALTKILASEFAAYGILVNTMSPGWVRTDMGGAGASRSVEKGAETAVWLASDEKLNETGNFYADKEIIEW